MEAPRAGICEWAVAQRVSDGEVRAEKCADRLVEPGADRCQRGGLYGEEIAAGADVREQERRNRHGQRLVESDRLVWKIERVAQHERAVEGAILDRVTAHGLRAAERHELGVRQRLVGNEREEF